MKHKQIGHDVNSDELSKVDMSQSISVVCSHDWQEVHRLPQSVHNDAERVIPAPTTSVNCQ
jgi:hypothetical protein